MLGLFYYWFAIADRYAIFLYEHLGATPLDEVTSSRYWMSGLVASGAVLVGYIAINWLLGRAHAPPPWWQVWLVCAPPLAIGIPLITMTVNWPTLPPRLAAACALTTLGGLALMPGALAAQRPGELTWLTLDGLGLMPSLLLLKAIELPGRGLFYRRQSGLPDRVRQSPGRRGLAGRTERLTPVAWRPSFRSRGSPGSRILFQLLVVAAPASPVYARGLSLHQYGL